MNVHTITMDPGEAQAKLDAYRAQLAKRHSQDLTEWRAAEAAYAELAKGTPLLDPIAAIREAGWRTDGRPTLAIARADQRFCAWAAIRTSRWWDEKRSAYVGPWSPMSWQFVATRTRRWDRQRSSDLRFEIGGVTEPPPAEPKTGCAMVPMVPADVFPARGCDLSKHFVLWEVESWAAAPPVDPILLRPIGGNLYAVVAAWDLTELERAIIAGTRSDRT